MKGWWRRPLLRLLATPLCLLLPVAVQAQQDASSVEREVRPFFGGAVGGGSVPGAFWAQCGRGNGFEVRSPALTADLRAGVGLGLLRLETRTTLNGSADLQSCIYTGTSQEQGVHTTRKPAPDDGGFAVTDARIGYATGDATVQFLFWGGAGWAWRHNIPVLLMGTGAHVGRTVRLTIGADLTAYRIPWDVVEAEWQDFQVVREVARRREEKWGTGFTVRLGAEIAPRLFRR